MIDKRTSVFDSFEKVASPTTSAMVSTIKVEIRPGALLQSLTSNFVRWLELKDPIKAERVGLTNEEMWDYVQHVLALESRDVAGLGLPKEARLLYQPPYLQELVHDVGNAVYRSGAKRVEIVSMTTLMEDERVDVVSSKLGAFEGTLPILRNAMPPRDSVNPDVMSCVVKSGSVYSLIEGQHPRAAFVAGLLGLTLVDEDRYGEVFDQECDSLSYMSSFLGGNYGIFG